MTVLFARLKFENVLGWPKSSFGFFHTMAVVMLSCLELHLKQFCLILL